MSIRYDLNNPLTEGFFSRCKIINTPNIDFEYTHIQVNRRGNIQICILSNSQNNSIKIIIRDIFNDGTFSKFKEIKEG